MVFFSRLCSSNVSMASSSRCRWPHESLSIVYCSVLRSNRSAAEAAGMDQRPRDTFADLVLAP